VSLLTDSVLYRAPVNYYPEYSFSDDERLLLITNKQTRDHGLIDLELGELVLKLDSTCADTKFLGNKLYYIIYGQPVEVHLFDPLVTETRLIRTLPIHTLVKVHQKEFDDYRRLPLMLLDSSRVASCWRSSMRILNEDSVAMELPIISRQVVGADNKLIISGIRGKDEAGIYSMNYTTGNLHEIIQWEKLGERALGCRNSFLSIHVITADWCLASPNGIGVVNHHLYKFDFANGSIDQITNSGHVSGPVGVTEYSPPATD
jgi:hypothetical protein